MSEYTLIQSIETVERPEISIIIPTIRKDKLDDVYNSILESTKRSFEIILVGPYYPTDFLMTKRNVKYVRDFGSPMRASNIGAMLCEGKLVTWSSDDGFFIKDALDNNIDTLYAMPPNPKNVVVAKYFEGQNYSGTDCHADSYYKLCNAYPRSPFIPVDWWIFNVAIMYREFFDELGAWDCKYQANAVGHADFAVRAQRAGAVVVMSPYPLLNCDHQPDMNVGDHKPIVVAQLGEDEPLYRQDYSTPLDNKPIKVDIMNWKKCPLVWKKRF